MNIEVIRKELQNLSNQERADFSKKYFHPQAEQITEKFLGVRVPDIRKLSKKFKNLSITELKTFLHSNVHEEKQLALFILVIQYKEAKKEEKKLFVDFFLENLDFVDNWDLIDDSAPKILGHWLLDKDKKLLYELAKAKNFWRRRISILSTKEFIQKNHFDTTMQLADLLLNDKEVLVQKAVGWMVREVYKKNPNLAKTWIEKNLLFMPRAMLRYAIEKVPEKERLKLLYGNG